MSPQLIGGALGLAAGLGVVTSLYYLPCFRRPTLLERVAPYVRDVSRPSKLLVESESQNPLTALERLAAPWVDRFTGALEQLSGNTASLQRRLDSSGSRLTVEQFRAQQLVLAVLGLAAGLVLTVGLTARGGGSPVALLLLTVVAGAVGVTGRDYLLNQQLKRRRARILVEFPTVAELLALSVGAGEGAMAAVDRVARTTNGALSEEFRRVTAEVHAGATVNDALNNLSRRVNLLLVTRFVDAMVVSMGNGTPLAEVLRAQAGDARSASRRITMEEGGKREIGMMAPVVFFILPITVLFACYPGFAVLNLGATP